MSNILRQLKNQRNAIIRMKKEIEDERLSAIETEKTKINNILTNGKETVTFYINPWQSWKLENNNEVQNIKNWLKKRNVFLTEQVQISLNKDDAIELSTLIINWNNDYAVKVALRYAHIVDTNEYYNAFNIAFEIGE